MAQNCATKKHKSKKSTSIYNERNEITNHDVVCIDVVRTKLVAFSLQINSRMIN